MIFVSINNNNSEALHRDFLNKSTSSDLVFLTKEKGSSGFKTHVCKDGILKSLDYIKSSTGEDVYFIPPDAKLSLGFDKEILLGGTPNQFILSNILVKKHE